MDSLLDGLELLRARFAVVPGLQRHEEEGVVAGAHEAEQAESNDAGRMLNTGCVGQNIFDFCGHIVGALKRRGSRKLNVYIDVALILIRKKTGGDFAPEPGGGYRESC